MGGAQSWVGLGRGGEARAHTGSMIAWGWAVCRCVLHTRMGRLCHLTPLPPHTSPTLLTAVLQHVSHHPPVGECHCGALAAERRQQHDGRLQSCLAARRGELGARQRVVHLRARRACALALQVHACMHARTYAHREQLEAQRYRDVRRRVLVVGTPRCMCMRACRLSHARRRQLLCIDCHVMPAAFL